MASSVSGGIFGDLFALYMVIALLVGGLVLGWLGYIMVKFRDRPGIERPRDAPKAGILPAERGHPIWSYVMAIVIAAIMFGLAFGTISAVDTLEKPPQEGDRLDARITGLQFGWQITFAGDGGVPLTLTNDWTLPVDTAIVADVVSKDVWHNFALPDYRIRIDVVPGQTNHIWWKATEVATTETVCVQICGTGHAQMKGVLHVVTKDEFVTFVAEKSQAEYAKLERAGNVHNGTFDGAGFSFPSSPAASEKGIALRIENTGGAETFRAGASSVEAAAGATVMLYVPPGTSSIDAVQAQTQHTLRSVS